MADNNEQDKLPPWHGADRARQGYPFSLRLTDYQKKQLDYIAAHAAGTRSAHQWVVSRLAPLLEAEAEALWQANNLKIDIID